MSTYKNKSEMFRKRAEQLRKQADVEWSKAKNGQGDYHYAKAKKLYAMAEENEKKAEQYEGDETW